MRVRIGVAAVARPTFDVPFARDRAAVAWRCLAELGHELIGTPDLILDADALSAVADGFADEQLDALVVIQATFTDSTMAAAIADSNPAPLVLWALPEARTGGRLRLNSFCGINLAGYRLARAGRSYRYLYCDPAAAMTSAAIAELLDQAPPTLAPISARSGDLPTAAVNDAVAAAAHAVRERLAHSIIGVVGVRPDGFEPCDYDAAVLATTTGVTAETATMTDLFERAGSASVNAIQEVRVRVSDCLTGVERIDPDGLDRSLRLHLGLRGLIDERRWSGVATRCWPECFTDFGAACCAPHAMLNDDGVPGCCEADAYGTVTSLILQWFGNGPAFVADLVDLDPSDQTGVFWHCGMAPLAMSTPGTRARATIHSNRQMPLLNEFPLRPGRVSIARLSQSRGLSRLTIGGGEMLDEPLPYAGTGGVIRFDRPVQDVMDTIMTEGHEHHYGLVYGDVRAELYALAAELDLPVIAL